MKIDLSWIFLGMFAIGIGSCSGLTNLGKSYEKAEIYKADRAYDAIKYQEKHRAMQP